MESDTYPYDVALIVTINAPSYKDALIEAEQLAEGIGAAEEVNISAVLDYERDNVDQRVLYLHPIEDGKPTEVQ